jgi:maltose O-acetyltransferase
MSWFGKLLYNLVNAVQQWGVFPGGFRTRIVRLLGHKLSAETFIAQGVFFTGSRLTTEGVVSINVGSLINADAPIHIESGVRIACDVKLITATHRMGTSHQRAGDTLWLPIRIGTGCWIGVGAIILPGVTVAPGCMIAAGAVVAKDTELNGLYAGVPARRRKTLCDHDAINFEVLRAPTKASNSAFVGAASAAKGTEAA